MLSSFIIVPCEFVSTPEAHFPASTHKHIAAQTCDGGIGLYICCSHTNAYAIPGIHSPPLVDPALPIPTQRRPMPGTISIRHEPGGGSKAKFECRAWEELYLVRGKQWWRRSMIDVGKRIDIVRVYVVGALRHPSSVNIHSSTQYSPRPNSIIRMSRFTFIWECKVLRLRKSSMQSPTA